jgi:hypothetical protein
VDCHGGRLWQGIFVVLSPEAKVPFLGIWAFLVSQKITAATLLRQSYLAYSVYTFKEEEKSKMKTITVERPVSIAFDSGTETNGLEYSATIDGLQYTGVIKLSLGEVRIFQDSPLTQFATACLKHAFKLFDQDGTDEQIVQFTVTAFMSKNF